MDFRWFKEKTKHWKRAGEDWLCFRKSSTENVASMILYEGSHHYFEELHVHLSVPNQESSTQQFTLEGPGPFEMELFPNTDCLILARTRFLPYTITPCKGGASHLARCAGVRRVPDGPVEEFEFGVAAPVAAHTTYGELPSVASLIKKFTMHMGNPVPEIFTASFGANRSVSLRQEAEHETLICFIADQAPAFDLAPGKSVDLDRLRAAWPDVISIPAGKTSAVPETWNPRWTLALPLACLSATQGVVGAPLILAPLIADLKVISAAPKNVIARWRWLAPPPWMRVTLRWEYYNNDGWATSGLEERPVSWLDYNRTGHIELVRYDDMNELSDWSVELTAVAHVHGTEDDGHSPLVDHARL